MSQAVAAPSTGDCVIVGGKSVVATGISGDLAGSRRAVLAGMLLGSVAIATPAVAMTSQPLGWAGAVARWRSAKAAHKKASQAFTVAQQNYYMDRPSPLANIRYLPDDSPETFNARVEQSNAEFAQTNKACRDRHRLDALEQASSDAMIDADEALFALLDEPAPNVAAIIVKIELALAQGCEVKDIAPVLDDLRRMAA